MAMLPNGAVLCCLASTSANDFGDLARLTWRGVDLDSGEIAFTTRKTERRIVLPLVQPLSKRAHGERQSKRLHLSKCATPKRTNSLSNQFREIMADAGLVEARSHEKTKRGR